jgi:site-specific DNA-methyltransferase (cytosine-N4-specific)
LRVRKVIKNYDNGDAFRKFINEVSKQFDRIYPYLTVLGNRNICNSFSIRNGNSINIDSIFPEFKKQIDLIITSPPYATALPYLDTERLSLIVLGLLQHTDHKVSESLMVGTREISEKMRKSNLE